MKTVAIIGAGAAGLMAAEMLSQTNLHVIVYDAMPSAGRKFLMAGKGGMNISHAEDFSTFVTRYGTRQKHLEPYLNAFTPTDLRAWLADLGIETFIGSSRRIFPKEMKAAPLLRAWLHRLRSRGVQFSMRHRWLGWKNNDTKKLIFDTPNGEQVVNVDAVILALGGGSWSRLGSTGDWVSILREQGVIVETLQPSNCGFNTAWSDYFKQRFAGQPLKNVQLQFGNFQQKGELMITEHGIEGGLIYAASSLIRNAIFETGKTTIHLDLFPDKTEDELMARLNKPRGKTSTAQFWRRQLKLDGVKAGLVREILRNDTLNSSELVVQTLKKLPLTLLAPRPIDEAISSAGGVNFDELNTDLMCKKLTGVFCAGEMLDWEAPTGGYLLTACLATGRAVGLGMATWLAESYN
ncbi:MAG: TIGR03862 family flavoprotein [Methylococcales bacterium]|nr:TIGR03862 family flavoprotein [Methylococcales bacterium]MDD5753896.1 TIGR03862 family flavoprotein [Methylococcales bacterium]